MGNLPTIDYQIPKAAGSTASERTASLALALATVFWGFAFTWAKLGGEAVQDVSGLGRHAAFGPIFLLAWRFGLAGIVWLLIFPEARRGWTLPGIRRSFCIGGLLAISIAVQHLGLDYTSQTVSAFLTSLTIMFVPILMTIVLRKPPRAILWGGVAVATAGVWLMTGATPTGFGLGEWLGLACALAFSVYILAVNAVSSYETPWRMTAGQFLTTSVICFAVCAMLPGGVGQLAPTAMAKILADPGVWINLLLMIALPTLVSYGILQHFQPRLDPARAALIYLLEPVAAAAYAMIATHDFPSRRELMGAFLILLANALVELLSARAAQVPQSIVD